MAITLDSVISGLKSIYDPDLKKDLITLGMVKDLKLEGGGVSLRLVVKSSNADIAKMLEGQVTSVLMRAGANQVNLKVENDAPRKPAVAEKHGVPGVKYVIAVGSGKGGVGKSTVSSNLAVALAKSGAKVGLLDCDIYGPNIPLMMGVTEPPFARQDEARGELIIPQEAHGVKVMSMGMLVRGDQPMVWRGPMLHSTVSQFLFKVDWGNLDYLIIDMPPGTGDVQLSLTQLIPLTGAVIVTTPQEVALQDVRKAILMLEKVGVPILGIVENMSYFVCDSCEKKHEIFGTGGGENLADKYRVKLLTKLPLEAIARKAGDSGAPVTLANPNSVLARSFNDLARQVSHQVESLADAAGTSSGAPMVEIGKF